MALRLEVVTSFSLWVANEPMLLTNQLEVFMATA